MGNDVLAEKGLESKVGFEVRVKIPFFVKFLFVGIKQLSAWVFEDCAGHPDQAVFDEQVILVHQGKPFTGSHSDCSIRGFRDMSVVVAIGYPDTRLAGSECI